MPWVITFDKVTKFCTMLPTAHIHDHDVYMTYFVLYML